MRLVKEKKYTTRLVTKEIPETWIGGKRRDGTGEERATVRADHDSRVVTAAGAWFLRRQFQVGEKNESALILCRVK